MHNKNGFLLMEFVVYFFLLTALGTLIATFLVATQQRMNKQRATQQSIMNGWFAADRFVCDIRRAPAVKKSWKKIENNCLIWQDGVRDIGWFIQDGALYRVEGSWHEAQAAWGARTKNLVADKIKRCDFSLMYDATGHVIKGCSIDMAFLVDGNEQVTHRIVAVTGGVCG